MIAMLFINYFIEVLNLKDFNRNKFQLLEEEEIITLREDMNSSSIYIRQEIMRRKKEKKDTGVNPAPNILIYKDK
ncbi:hypothetical protein [Aeromonas caviae]|uniref:hypothetical protein n=1 Tax=Aeromonas caviae TaxID=648 RepID=UPI0024484549|nr:hypothetical protein [Aeromonas caviae]MDH0306691.1 hypothetical protein [Aeromonas caviae]